MRLNKSSADSHVAKIRAKMASAEIKARQLEMEEERRTKEFAKQLEIKHKIEQAGNVAQRIELEAKERRKTHIKTKSAHKVLMTINSAKIEHVSSCQKPLPVSNLNKGKS